MDIIHTRSQRFCYHGPKTVREVGQFDHDWIERKSFLGLSLWEFSRGFSSSNLDFWGLVRFLGVCNIFNPLNFQIIWFYLISKLICIFFSICRWMGVFFANFPTNFFSGGHILPETKFRPFPTWSHLRITALSAIPNQRNEFEDP